MNTKLRRKLLTALIIIFFLIVCFIVLFPLYYMFMASFKSSKELFRNGMDFRIIPSLMSLDNYKLLFSGKGSIYLYWYRNSLSITALHTVVSLFLSSLVGYGLGAYNFRGKNIVFMLVLFVMMVPLEILMLPLYKLIVKMGIINTYYGVILPFVVSPMAIFFFRQYITGVSKDYMDAGRIDGCSEFGIFIRIMAPLMKPAFGAMGILLAMQNWNSFIWPLIVLRTNKMFTIPIGLASLMSPYGNNYDMLIAGAVLAIIPVILLFLVNQRAFISGLSSGGVKG
ncbi:carbohydrate ABC transporter permease [Paenibacillus chondroitinus]|uniref:Carbohydrate ABC transporter permease n=1 Tax=Paenibacillus chondroitinus TaxID=59842 RepID=A0ABU6DCP3_9BACL|nr:MULTISPECIES: carbohydrate ABC transporter permease [Paenibacillus]MCY9659938.1 carbohydrate ABC transporter permease [Paenibacillus anseongense]MEB4795444.1 carbohydrate ABC transporter permease [Paenibacillus chondroitinus]